MVGKNRGVGRNRTDALTCIVVSNVKWMFITDRLAELHTWKHTLCAVRTLTSK